MVDTLMSRDPAGMPELIEFINDGPTVYLVVFGLVMLDAIFPLAPSETLLVSGGVLVASGDIAIVPLVLAGAAGALAGHVAGPRGRGAADRLRAGDGEPGGRQVPGAALGSETAQFLRKPVNERELP